MYGICGMYGMCGMYGIFGMYGQGIKLYIFTTSHWLPRS